MKLAKVMRRIGGLCFNLMWLPFITIFIGMIGMPSGEYAWSEIPLLTRYSIVAVVFFMVAGFGLIIGSSVVGAISNRSIRKNGKPAQAQILRVADTGTTINDDPVVRLLLEVQPLDEPAFKAEAEQLIPRLKVPQIQPGATVQVKYDPDSRTVALV